MDSLAIHAKLDLLDLLGMIHWPEKKNGKPRLKMYLRDMQGMLSGDLWADIKPIGQKAVERTGYPTQKPLKLLGRIIKASSNEGDIILDPFCGCATTCIAAQNDDRKWRALMYHQKL